MPAPLLSPDQQDDLVTAAYDAPGYVSAARELGLSPESVQLTKRTDEAFAARLEDVVAFRSEQIGDALTALFFDPSLPAKDRLSLGKQLLRQRPPASWKRPAAKKAATKTATGDGVRDGSDGPADGRGGDGWFDEVGRVGEILAESHRLRGAGALYPPADAGGSPGDVGGSPGDVGGSPGRVGGSPDYVGGSPGDVGGSPSVGGAGPSFAGSGIPPLHPIPTDADAAETDGEWSREAAAENQGASAHISGAVAAVEME